MIAFNSLGIKNTFVINWQVENPVLSERNFSSFSFDHFQYLVL